MVVTRSTRHTWPPADLARGPDGYVLTIEFGAPTPLGMLR
jgi:hypothetical protein